ncbi:unnamed protein product [Didymodactylos carnosus]|uniref:Uncharacterized protein n=1 Tax=Didymodactylos carnosus TaxID=1234261 RepID=A0A8S2CW71_9BILA|nr:unnamed protein product [Didymodactylos carnosus]CAF3570947.1 unnamed protein product [Didymodactylos carnosus]
MLIVSLHITQQNYSNNSSLKIIDRSAMKTSSSVGVSMNVIIALMGCIIFATLSIILIALLAKHRINRFKTRFCGSRDPCANQSVVHRFHPEILLRPSVLELYNKKIEQRKEKKQFNMFDNALLHYTVPKTHSDKATKQLKLVSVVETPSRSPSMTERETKSTKTNSQQHFGLKNLDYLVGSTQTFAATTDRIYRKSIPPYQRRQSNTTLCIGS